jgi:hypothetical protein
MKGRENRIGIFLAFGILAAFASSLAAVARPGLVWMVFADPAGIAGTFSLRFFVFRCSYSQLNRFPD